jgi:hypothetical protein
MGLLRGAASAVGIRLADARAAVRNSASRRVNDPVIVLLKKKGDTMRSQTTDKTGTSQTAGFVNATTLG